MIFKYLILKTPVFFGFFAGGRGISFLSDSNSMYGNQAKAATTTTSDLYYTISKICAEKLSTTNHQHGWYHTFIDCDLYSRHRCTCWRLLLLQCITGFLPIAWVKSELSLSLILKCLSGFFLIITQAILTSFWLEEFRFCTTECEMTFPAISSLASGHFRLPSAVFPFRAASEILKLPKFSLQQCLRVTAACRQRFWTPFESNH